MQWVSMSAGTDKKYMYLIYDKHVTKLLFSKQKERKSPDLKNIPPTFR